jgi:hypothetical protein
MRLDQNLQMLKQFDKINVSVKNIRIFGYLLRSFGFNTPIEAASFASHYGVLSSRIPSQAEHRLDPGSSKILI